MNELITRSVELVKAGKIDLRKEMEELKPQITLCANFDHPDKEVAVAEYNKHRRFAFEDI